MNDMVPRELAQLIRRYCRSQERIGRLCKDTADRRARLLWRFAAEADVRSVDDLTRRRVLGWLEDRGRQVGAGTLRTNWTDLAMWFGWLVREGFIDASPIEGEYRPKAGQMVPRAVATDLAGLVLAAAPDSRARLVIVLMLQQGLRCIEVSRLQAADIDHVGRAMIVRGKHDKERVLPVMDETWRALLDWWADCPDARRTGPVIRSRMDPAAGVGPGFIGRLTREAMYESGVKKSPGDGVTPHGLRHTMATDMARSGANVRDIQAALGHASLQSTQVYMPLVVNGLAIAMGGRTYDT